jgi:hypothetical protein
MRNVTSHSVIIAVGYEFAEFTHLAGEVSHRVSSIAWLNVPHQITSLAFAILCVVGFLHVVPIVASAGIVGCNIVIALHTGITSLWFEMCNRFERALVDSAKGILWKMLDWLERQK